MTDSPMNQRRNATGLAPVSSSLKMNLLKMVLIAVSYFFAHQVSFLFPDAAKVMMAVWPAGGIGLAALLLSPRRQWPVILPVLFTSGIAADLLAGREFFLSVGFMTANILESLGSAWLIFRWCGECVRFTRVKEVLALIVAASGVNACTSLLGAGIAVFFSMEQFWVFWKTWWVADGLGILLITPLIITWGTCPKSVLIRARWNRIIELGIAMMVWCAAAWILFQSSGKFLPWGLRPYMLVPLAVWIALRFDQRSMMFALFVLTIMTITGAFLPDESFPWVAENPMERLLVSQVFLGAIAGTGMLLAAVSAERRKEEKALRESEQRFRSVFMSMSEGFALHEIICDTSGVPVDYRFLDVNPAFEIQTGLKRVDIVGKRVLEVLPQTELLWIERYGKVALTGNPVQFESYAASLDKHYSVAAFCPRKGQVAVIFNDVSERKRTEEVLTKLTEAKSRFVSTVSHELRSPLATIKAATDIVCEGLVGPLNHEQKDTLGTAKENIDRLGRLINNVLTYQQAQAGKINCDFRENDLNETIRRVYKSGMLLAGNRKTDLVMELASDLPKIKFDQDKIFEVLVNLVANAIKYSESGNIIIRSRQEDHEIHVSVRDSGVGISPEYLNEIFEPFAQVGDNRRSGTGLGLAIAKEVVLAHRGKIWAVSEVGKGSVFHFTLPL